MSTIVLAHGIFGFGNLLPSFIPTVHYFNGVRAHLEDQGHTVLEPQVNPIGSVQQRGNQLAEFLKDAGAGEPLHIIAHSMGGLDARHAITNRRDIVQRVATLVTIGTPHRGSPVADAVANPANPLFKNVPRFLVEQLEANAALHDLTTKGGIHFDETTGDVDGVRYIEVAGDASQGSHGLLLFDLAERIGNIAQEINDGVVTKSSALRQVQGHEHLDDWPVDHAGEIGWSHDSPLPIIEVKRPLPIPLLPAARRHLARYDAIVRML
jgi:triacylglycerol lipase